MMICIAGVGGRPRAQRARLSGDCRFVQNRNDFSQSQYIPVVFRQEPVRLLLPIVHHVGLGPVLPSRIPTAVRP